MSARRADGVVAPGLKNLCRGDALMSILKINLRKLLQIMFAEYRQQKSLVLEYIRKDRVKKSSDDQGGGDFYGPFWKDAKQHVAGKSDIITRTQARIDANKSRKRLYPMLRDGFLELWNEKMRWRNEPFEFFPESIKARKEILELDAVVKIENTASVKLWDGSSRIIYPYFYEEPALSFDGARLGFCVLWAALPECNPSHFRIIDLQNRSYFRPSDIKFTGREEEEFLLRYKAVIDLWIRLQEK